MRTLKLLESKHEEEQKLINLPVKDFIIKDVRNNQIIFENSDTRQEIYGDLFFGYRYLREDWFSAFIFTFLNPNLPGNCRFTYYSRPSDIYDFLEMNIGEKLDLGGLSFFFRVRQDKSIYGLISNRYNFTDKIKILDYIWAEMLNLKNHGFEIKYSEFENNEKKVQINFYINQITFIIAFGNDNGFSKYEFFLIDKTFDKTEYAVKEWKHNLDLNLLWYRLKQIISEINKRQNVKDLNFINN